MLKTGYPQYIAAIYAAGASFINRSKHPPIEDIQFGYTKTMKISRIPSSDIGSLLFIRSILNCAQQIKTFSTIELKAWSNLNLRISH
jgi:hypothetical protein